VSLSEYKKLATIPRQP